MSDSRAPTVRRVGRYVVFDEIGHGGMASVHIGRLVGPVGFSRTVAIKRLHAHLARDPEFVAMFLDEARLATRIRHPNVVPTVDVVSEDDELSLVLEYVHGESLARLWHRCVDAGGPLPPPIAVAIMIQVLHGLHAAHEARTESGEPLEIVHRDVSPQNVLVGVDGVARVLDFGVAKAIGRLQTTRAGKAKGKLAYMSPEQLTRTDVGRQTDVYAAAIVLWELLTGRHLFAGDSEGIVYGKVLSGGGAPPSHHAADVSPALDAIVLRGLEPDLDARFPTAREMALSLEGTNIATPSQVATWVEGVVGDLLAERTALLARIEADTEAVQGEPLPPVAITKSAVETAPTAPLAAVPNRTSRVRGFVLSGLGVVLAVVLAVAFRSRASHPESPRPTTISPGTSASVAEVATDTTTNPALPRTTVPVTLPSASTPRSPRARAPRTKPRTPDDDCQPPVWIDESGFKHYKPQCVR